MASREPLGAVKGMNDIYPGAAERFFDSALWQHLLGTTAEVFAGFGYEQVWLPALEQTPLFARSIGEETDIVTKEMFTFEDRGGRSLTLRPEGTAGAVRAYIEHNLSHADPMQRWWYFGPMFRAERPQKGRYRQFYQIGAELLGAATAAADAELVAMFWQLCQRLGLADVQARVNSLGDSASRAAYSQRLKEHLRAHAEGLCESCRARIETNPLRALDCKRESCRAIAARAPDVLESLAAPARAHFDRVQAILRELGVGFVRDPRLVRGLDYYTGVVFEFTTTALGAQDAIMGGGRYDELTAELGGAPTAAIGFAAGVERIALLVSERWAGRPGPDLYLVPMAGAETRALALAAELRPKGPWRVEVDVSGARLKHQMRRADRLKARFALVLGESELASGRGRLKDLSNSSEIEVNLESGALDGALSAKP